MFLLEMRNICLQACFEKVLGIWAIQKLLRFRLSVAERVSDRLSRPVVMSIYYTHCTILGKRLNVHPWISGKDDVQSNVTYFSRARQSCLSLLVSELLSSQRAGPVRVRVFPLSPARRACSPSQGFLLPPSGEPGN